MWVAARRVLKIRSFIKSKRGDDSRMSERFASYERVTSKFRKFLDIFAFEICEKRIKSFRLKRYISSRETHGCIKKRGNRSFSYFLAVKAAIAVWNQTREREREREGAFLFSVFTKFLQWYNNSNDIMVYHTIQLDILNPYLMQKCGCAIFQK